LVKEWGLVDDASNVLIFSKKGKILFYKAVELSADEIKEAIDFIENNLE
jgi:predicted transcriptional regulator